MRTGALETDEYSDVIAGFWLAVWNQPGRRVITLADLDFPDGRKTIVVGKSRSCDLFVEGDEKISGVHWELEARTDGLWVRDLGSTNGTKVNGVPVQGRVKLRKGFRVKFGRSTVEALGVELRPVVEGATYTSWMCDAVEKHGSARAAEDAIHRAHSTISYAQRRRKARDRRVGGKPGNGRPGAVTSPDGDSGRRP